MLLLGRRLGRGEYDDGKHAKEEEEVAPAAEREVRARSAATPLTSRALVVAAGREAPRVDGIFFVPLVEKQDGGGSTCCADCCCRKQGSTLLSEEPYNTLVLLRRRRRSTPANDADEAIALGFNRAHRWVRLCVESLMMSPRPSAVARQACAIETPEAGLWVAPWTGEAVGTWAYLA
jgi:hypothetical protein